MRKLYTDVTLETPFMVSYNDEQIQACANDEDTITIGAEEFVRVTDANGHNVSDGEGNQLLLNDGVIYLLVDGVPESTNITVTDVEPPEPSENYSLTVNVTNQEIVDANIMIYDSDWTHSGTSSEGKTLTVSDIPSDTYMFYSVSAIGYYPVSGSTSLVQDEIIDYELVPVEALDLSALSSSGETYSGVYDIVDTSKVYIEDSQGSRVKTNKGHDVFFYATPDGVDRLLAGDNAMEVYSENNHYIGYNPFTFTLFENNPMGSSVAVSAPSTCTISFTFDNTGMSTATDTNNNLEITTGLQNAIAATAAQIDAGSSSITVMPLELDFENKSYYCFFRDNMGVFTTPTVGENIVANSSSPVSHTVEFTFDNSGN